MILSDFIIILGSLVLAPSFMALNFRWVHFLSLSYSYNSRSRSLTIFSSGNLNLDLKLFFLSVKLILDNKFKVSFRSILLFTFFIPDYLLYISTPCYAAICMSMLYCVVWQWFDWLAVVV